MQLGLPPSEQDRLTVDQFETLRAHVDRLHQQVNSGEE